GVARPIRFQLLDRLHQPGGQYGQGHLGVNDQAVRSWVRSELAVHHATETLAKAWNGLRLNTKASGGGVPAVADQVGGAFLQRLVQLEPRHRAARSLAMRLTGANSDHEH